MKIKQCKKVTTLEIPFEKKEGQEKTKKHKAVITRKRYEENRIDILVE